MTDAPAPAIAFDRAKVEALLAAMPPDKATRMRGLYEKWLHPEKYPLTRLQEAELKTEKMIPDMNGIGTQEPFCSRREIAERLTKETGKTVSEYLVRDRLKRWPDLKRKNNSVDYAGFKRRFVGDADATANGFDTISEDMAGRRLKLARAKREERKDEQEQRRFDAAWMVTSTAFFIMDSFGVTLKNLLRDSIERILWGRMESAVKEIITDESLRQKLLEKIRPMFPAAFDQMQIDMGLKLDELGREATEMNKQHKEEMK